MKNKLQRFKRALVLCCFIIIAFSCENDNSSMSSEIKLVKAQKWFNQYESNGNNYDLFQNLNYDWNQASIKNSEDGTETIIVPVIELKKDQREIWSQKLYIYKLEAGEYKALVFETYSNKNVELKSQSIEGGDFTGYMTVWDLKEGFVRAAKFVNNQVIEEGVAEFSTNKGKTNKAPADPPCIYADFGDGGCGGRSGGDSAGIALRPVIVTGPSTGTPVIYNPRGPVIGGTDPGGYTSPNGGGGANSGGGSAIIDVPPSCESFNFTVKKGANWQEALVKNIKFKIVLLTPNGFKIDQIIEYAQPISFGMPVSFTKGNGDVSTGVAATVSAKVLEVSMREAVTRYAGTEVSELTVRLYFQERLIQNYRTYTNGGIVNFNSTSNIVATTYKTNPLGTGNCD